MRKNSLLQLLGLVTIITLVCTTPIFAATEDVEITGTVFVSEWDANNNATAVVIATEEGEEIVVSNSGKGMELLKLDEKSVTATGTIAIAENGTKTIKVTKYMINE